MELFDYLKNITTNKQELDFSSDEVKKNYEPYIINRWVSMCDMYLDIACAASMLDVDKETHHRFFVSALPKRFIKFEYIKKKKESLSKETINNIYDYFKFGTNDFDNIIDQLSTETINEIDNKYKYGKV